MKRFTAKLVQGVSRLAFWRKLADLVWEKPESPAPVTAKDSMPQAADAGKHADAPASKTSLFARLKHALRRRRNPDPELPAVADQAVVAEPPARKQRDPEAQEDAPALPKRSLLAVLKSKLRRAPPAESLATELRADEHSPPSRAPMQRESDRSRDSAEAEEAAPPNPRQRALAVLANKWVWIPGLSILLLVPLITMALMLVQSSQEKTKLQTQLVATQKKLDQAAAEKKAAAKPQPLKPAGAPAVAAADTAPSPATDGTQTPSATGECEISSKESVALNLKNCIEGFNAMSQ